MSEWEIKESDYGADAVYLDGGVLKADTKLCGDGALTLTGVDDQGNLLEFRMTISVSGLIGMLIMAAAGLILLALAAVLLLVLRKKMKGCIYKGDIMAIAFDNNLGMMDAPQTIRPDKGQVPMSRYLSEGGGVDLRQNYFKADESADYIWVISKAGLYSSLNQEKKEKKIRLYNGMEVTVSKNRDLDCGIQLTYTADQM